MKVLLVEDDPAISSLLQRYLGRNQHEVAAFASSPAALEAFRANPNAYDVAITDLSLKHISGEELVLKFLELRPDFPVVIATGYSYSVSHLPAAVRPCVRVLLKPFLPKQVIEILAAIGPAPAPATAPVALTQAPAPATAPAPAGITAAIAPQLSSLAVALHPQAAPVLAREYQEESARINARLLRRRVPAGPA